MMKTICVLLFLSVIEIAQARADVLPPATKNIPVEYRIETEKEYPDWLFYVVTGNHAARPVKFAPGSPVVIHGNAAIGKGPASEKGSRPYRSNALVAVPKDAAGKYPKEEELLAALKKDDVPGMIQTRPLNDHNNVPEGSRAVSITKNYLVEELDPKKGIVLKELGKDDSNGSDTAEATNRAPPAVVEEAKTEMWIVGVCLALAIALTGLYYIRRSRSKNQS